MIYEQSNLFLEYPLCLKRVVDVLFGCFSSHQQWLMEISITFTKVRVSIFQELQCRRFN